MIRVTKKGDFKNTERFLTRNKKLNLVPILERYGREGVAALAANTPVDQGTTAASWDYHIKIEDGRSTINWTNSNTNQGVNIALLIQHGHGTGYGGYVAGIDYINPAIQPIFTKIASDVWREVIGL